MQEWRFKFYSTLLIVAFGITCSLAQDYKTIWDHINKNERSDAIQLLEPKIKNNNAGIDEYLTYLYLKIFDGQDGEVTDFEEHIRKSDNPDAYIYALWFNASVQGPNPLKETHQLDLLNQLISAQPGNGTLRASAHYSLGNHYIRVHKLNLIKNEYDKMGALTDWQFVGPFNNLSGSGFNKNYEPIQDASNTTVFASANNAPIKWFTPVEKSTECWISTGYFISDNSGGITFAQSFVNSPKDQEVYLCTGFAGNMKVWVNDQLIISVPENRVTEIDAYNSKCHLNAGYNRILVQLGSDDDYPNFIIRLTDTYFEPIPNLKSIAEPQNYKKAKGELLSGKIDLFAETFFIDKIKKEPGNILNYILLNEVYLRNKKVFEARHIIEKALALAPDNSILRYELLLCYNKEGNRTGMAEQYEYFLEHEKESLMSYIFRVKNLESQGKYQEAIDDIKKRILRYGNDESTYDELIQAYAKLNSVPEMVALINEAFQLYPDNDRFLNYTFNVEQKLNKNPKKAVNLLENYLTDHYDYTLTKLLIREEFNLQNTTKPYKLLDEQIKTWPFSPSIRLDLLNEYLGQQRYKEAYELSQYMLTMMPYSGSYYQNKATIEESMQKVPEAILSYRMALKYEPTLYDSRDKLRTLEKKDNLFETVSDDKIDDLISHTGKNIKTDDYDYYYIQDEAVIVLYPEGGREEMHTAAIKILNQRGIDKFSDLSLPYNSNTEALIIEDAQLIKSNGNKIKPEINDNQIVWTGLEANDIIYCKYKIKEYMTDKFAREFYDKFIFQDFVPTELSRYSVILPADRKINYTVSNGEIKPEIRDIDEYKMYIWKQSNTPAINSELYMPPTTDVVPTVHVSTMNEWNEIAEWYNDVVYSKIASDNDYEVTELYNELFAGKKEMTADEKARTIYDYISSNINYSSVSFRQSSIVPQKASKTINTHLGDCKDISTLFVSLAKLCGLKANLVLVSTQDNGKKDMVLPSFLFDHCIVKYFDDQNNEHFLELTDRDLPFQSLPASLYQAMSLTIPSKVNEEQKQNLVPINASNKTIDKVLTKTNLVIESNDMDLTYTTIKYGSLTSNLRSTYRSLSEENINKKMQESLSGLFTNPIKISNVSLKGLAEFNDSISISANLKVTNEVKKIGSLWAFAIPYTDVIYSASPFNPEKRIFDFEYWNYENTDEYITEVEVSLPAQKEFVELPQNENFSFHDITYSISYMKTEPGHLRVVRKAHINRDNISSQDYEEFKEFVTGIINAEGTYITFK